MKVQTLPLRTNPLPEPTPRTHVLLPRVTHPALAAQQLLSTHTVSPSRFPALFSDISTQSRGSLPASLSCPGDVAPPRLCSARVEQTPFPSSPISRGRMRLFFYGSCTGAWFFDGFGLMRNHRGGGRFALGAHSSRRPEVLTGDIAWRQQDSQDLQDLHATPPLPLFPSFPLSLFPSFISQPPVKAAKAVFAGRNERPSPSPPLSPPLFPPLPCTPSPPKTANRQAEPSRYFSGACLSFLQQAPPPAFSFFKHQPPRGCIWRLSSSRTKSTQVQRVGAMEDQRGVCVGAGRVGAGGGVEWGEKGDGAKINIAWGFC